MRVLHVTSSFPRTEDDHVAPFLLDLVRAQVDEGLDVIVLAPHDAGTPTAAQLEGARIERFRYAPARLEQLAYRGGLLNRARTVGGALVLPLFFIAFARAIAAAVRRHRPDVIHAHWWLPAGMCALPAHLRHRCPLVVTLHGSDVHLLRRPLMRRLARAVLARADLVAVVSEQMRVQVAEKFGWPANRVHVLRLPVGSPIAPTPLPANQPPRVLAAGRLSYEKGFDVLLDAVDSLVRDGGDLCVELVGSGPEEPKLAARTARLAERVQRRPAMARRDLWSLMDRCDALVMPSRREGLPLMALEALARGRPVIASRVGGIPEIVADSDGVLVPPDDPNVLAAALRRLPLPAPDGDALRRHAPRIVAAEHAAAYASCASAHADTPLRMTS